MIILLAIALLIDGIARVIHGIADKTSRSWSRIFRIAAGVIAIVLALVIIASPVIGAALVGILLGIALLIIIGIEIIARGVSTKNFINTILGRESLIHKKNNNDNDNNTVTKIFAYLKHICYDL